MTEKLKYKVGDKVYLPFEIDELKEDYVRLSNEDMTYITTEDTVSVLSMPFRHKVPQVAIEFYNEYKDDCSTFEEWFSDFYNSGFLEDFPQGEKLAKWLYDNDDKTNGERELALATLITYGPEAVEVEKEKMYRVRLKNGKNKWGQVQSLVVYDGNYHFSGVRSGRLEFTKKELIAAGFEGVFDNPMFEVEEVE